MFIDQMSAKEAAFTFRLWLARDFFDIGAYKDGPSILESHDTFLRVHSCALISQDYDLELDQDRQVSGSGNEDALACRILGVALSIYIADLDANCGCRETIFQTLSHSSNRLLASSKSNFGLLGS